MSQDQAESEREVSPMNHPVPSEGAPVASSDQFDRKRTPSLAAELLSAQQLPGHKATIQFVRPGVQATVLEACETPEESNSQNIHPLSSEQVITNLLFTLRSLQMASPDKHAAAIRRLQDLEKELRAAGAVCPPDPMISGAIAKALSTAGPNSDVQIRVNSSRHTTTTKTVYESDTPGMQGLDAEAVQRLQQQLLANLSAATAAQKPAQPEPAPATDQKHENMAEGFTTADGSTVVSKKMTRVTTTTKSSVQGSGPTEQNAGDLIRLKVNEQIYAGKVDPKDQHIHLVPITQLEQSAQPQ